MTDIKVETQRFSLFFIGWNVLKLAVHGERAGGQANKRMGCDGVRKHKKLGRRGQETLCANGAIRRREQKTNYIFTGCGVEEEEIQAG